MEAHPRFARNRGAEEREAGLFSAPQERLEGLSDPCRLDRPRHFWSKNEFKVRLCDGGARRRGGVAGGRPGEVREAALNHSFRRDFQRLDALAEALDIGIAIRSELSSQRPQGQHDCRRDRAGATLGGHQLGLRQAAQPAGAPPQRKQYEIDIQTRTILQREERFGNPGLRVERARKTPQVVRLALAASRFAGRFRDCHSGRTRTFRTDVHSTWYNLNELSGRRPWI